MSFQQIFNHFHSSYELILSRLVKHTNVEHPDQKPLQEAIHLVHSILLHLNCKEREALENSQRETLLRDLEVRVDGFIVSLRHC